MEIRPERGGRITSLRLSELELLDQGIGVDDSTRPGFVEAGAFGWDEMVPNLDAAGGLPDHGEAWRLPWTVVHASTSSAAMRCLGRLVPWELERKVELEPGAVLASYLYTNRGSEPHRAFWCAHPLFRYEAGMRIEVSGGAQVSTVGEGRSEKMFLAPGSVDRAQLRWESGAAVEIRWDRSVTPCVGVWVCNGDLGGYRQVAIEPATGGGGEMAPELGPGESLRWWLEIRDAR
jgi:hypothetical protein